ncbi:AMP-binding enzyme family protein [Histomonas meleagridis]|uniref:AMP-binding enzyme family protein n=1 Tax=Histomonas meleagridis TaxID=135588 RepID=UPI00355985FD|nr:AMP-binding enzyme family protein [Histomonas meleagridis]KAH0805925.1 AMP-binding enzyme family protein [Histomonas meleagridis]
MGQIYSTGIPPKCIPIDEETSPDESKIYRNIHCFLENGGQHIKTFRNQPDSHTAIDIMRVSSVRYANSPCTGERIIDENGNVGPYKYITYSEFYKRALAFGRGLLELGLTRGDKIGIYSSNSQWWQIAAFGSFSVGIIIVPVYDSFGKDAAQYIITHAEVKLVLCSRFKYDPLVNLVSATPNVTQIVIMSDTIPSEPASPIPVRTCQSVLELGLTSKLPNEFSKPEETAVLMYTSGSTGTPKGCIITQENLVAGGAALSSVNLGVGNRYEEDTFLSFLPLAHIYAMVVELMMYAHGIRVGFAQGQVKTLLDDIREMKPTMMIAVPRILNRVADFMRCEIKKLPTPLQKIIEWAIEDKAKNVRNNRGYSLLLDGILFQKFRNALGGRLRLIVNGGAPIRPDVFKFLSATVSPNIIQGYGLTEISAGLAVQEMPVTDYTTVGPASICCDVKLRKVKDTDYNPRGEIPTGELMVRGPGLFKEYYKQPDITKEAFDGEWFATGDVCEITPDGQIKIIDRAKQLVKLSQGEYLSLTTLSDMYSEADVLSFIFIYADSSHDQPIAVVFPKQEKIEEWNSRGITDVKDSQVVKDEIIKSLEKVFIEKKMRGFERITNVVVETEEPTIENGLLTPSLKPQLNSFKKKYLNALENLYQQIEKKKKEKAEEEALAEKEKEKSQNK